MFLTGVYGGYFGAAQGVILIALLAIFIHDDLQRLNGTKNALALTVNAVARLVFVASTHVAWSVAGLIAAARPSAARSVADWAVDYRPGPPLVHRDRRLGGGSRPGHRVALSKRDGLTRPGRAVGRAWSSGHPPARLVASSVIAGPDRGEGGRTSSVG